MPEKDQSSSQTRVSPLFVLFIGILAVSTASIFIRYAQRDVSSLVIAAYRLTFATLFLIPLALTRHLKELKNINKGQGILIVLSGIFLALHFATWITSLEFTSVASSVVLVTTTPLWVGLLGPFLIRERVSKYVAVGLVIALVGGIMVALSEACSLGIGGVNCLVNGFFFQGSFTGNILALFGALFAAGYILLGRRLRPSFSLVVYITSVYGVAAIVLVIMAIVSGQSIAGFPTTTYIFLVALAVFPQLIGHSSFNYGLRYLSAAYISVALLGEPIGSTILAFVILKETPTMLEIVGGMIILAGIYLATRSET